MTAEYYQRVCNDPDRKIIIAWRNKQYREKNREKLNEYNRLYGREYRKLK